jgi:signal transduction histidine kinase
MSMARYEDAATEVAAPQLLLVDDDPRNLLAIEAALDGVADIVRAYSGEEALRDLLERDFALVLLDVRLPGMDGFETAALIRHRPRSQFTPIIFMTAYDLDDQEVLKAYALGAVDFLFKPIVPAMLRAKASTFVDLQRERARVLHQEGRLREHEHREHARTLAEERRRWEEAGLRQQMDEERRISEELGRKTEELTRLIVELENAHRQLAQVNAELSQANQRKDQFLAVLSHELRNPLVPLVHGLELMRLHLEREGSAPGSPLRRIQASMYRQAATLRRLVDDLLDISRIDRGQIELRKEAVEVNGIVLEAIGSVRPLFEEQQQDLSLHPLHEPAWIHADPVRIAQILTNVLTNASRYTPAGGRIQVRCAARGEELAIAVSDNGSGISAELLPRIFEMFVQEHRHRSEGLGLGLALSRMLVEQHGGRIEAHSDGSGKGSTFTIHLPLATVPLHVASEPPEILAPEVGVECGSRCRSVVVVEDHPDVRESLRELLLFWGHRVEEATDGEGGLETILRVRPDIAFVDIGMPKLDGYSLARRVRQTLSRTEIRLVALTGYGQKADVARTREAGFDGHLVKPATPQALRQAFAELEASSPGAVYEEPN